jgi:hypothetical protein
MSQHDHSTPPSDTALRVKALESLLVEKGLVDPAALDALIDTYENKVGPRNGAAVVARAWADPDYQTRLLDDATAAIAELGYTGRQGEHMVAVEKGLVRSGELGARKGGLKAGLPQHPPRPADLVGGGRGGRLGARLTTLRLCRGATTTRG